MRRKPTHWLQSYRRAWAGADLNAGLTSAAVIVPKAMAYALIAGLPVEVGLYTALAAMLVYPLIGGSRPLSVSTTSSLAMLTGAEIIALVALKSEFSASQIASSLALLVGTALLLARLFKLGFLANFISKPVLIGFECGIGLVILVGQTKSLLGLHLEAKTTVSILIELPQALGQTHWPTFALSALGIAFLFLVPRLSAKLPTPLLWVALSTAAFYFLDLNSFGIASVGAIPAGLPLPQLPDWSLLLLLWPASLGLALMSFTESVAAARTFRAQDDPAIEPNRELIAVGLANLASGFCGGMPAGGGASQTAVASKAGCKSQMAQWVGALIILLGLLFFSRVVELLPQAALGALIFVAALSMIKPRDFRLIARIRKDEALWAIATLLGVVLLGTLEGILIAVAISILTLFYQANHPPVYALAYNRQGDFFRRTGEDAQDETIPGLLILRSEGRLTFANAERAADKMRDLLATSDARTVILELSAVPDIEYTALEMLIEAERNLRARGITLWLASLNPSVSRLIEKSSLGATMGKDRIFPNARLALAAFETRALSA